MPLTYRDRGTSGTQLDIISGSVVVGRVWKAVLRVTAGQQARWCWTCQAGPGSGPQQQGTANTLEERSRATFARQ